MDDAIEAQAARWYAAQDGDAMDWDGFAAWLEADPRHRAAFDAVALLGDALDTHRAAIAAALPPEAANDAAPADPAPRPRRAWGFGAGGALAAAALVLAMIGMPRAPAPIRYAAGAQQSRSIALADGSQIILAPASRLTVAGRDATDLTLEGSAWFDVPHRADRTLVVHLGGVEVRDVGTRFAATGDASGARVEVAQGSVAVASDRFTQTVTLRQGNSLLADFARAQFSLGTVDPADVASWRRGQLRYADMPLALVAEDISRYAGKRVTVDRALRDRRFSGVLTIGDGSRLASTLGSILGIAVRQDGGDIRLGAGR